MARNKLLQIDLHVDTDGPMAYFYRANQDAKFKPARGRGYYRVSIFANAERKRRFVDRVQRAQKALCQDLVEVQQ